MIKPNPLPNDVSRCPGIGNDTEGWHEDCERCLRRTSESHGPTTPWMTPPDIIAFWCEYLIEDSPK